jgi:hypothetical protein
MKKLFILISLCVFTLCNAQKYSWAITDQAKEDTANYNRSGGEDWTGMKVIISITIWELEDTTGTFLFGGHDNKVTAATSKQDWNYYSTDKTGVDIGPLLADTVSCLIFIPNEDSTRYNARLTIESFDFKLPAYKYTKNSNDSLWYYMLWQAYRK